MRSFLAGAGLLAAGLLSAPAACADLIEFKDGTKLRGTVKSRSASEVVIEFDFGTTGFAPGDIVAITPEAPPPAIAPAAAIPAAAVELPAPGSATAPVAVPVPAPAPAEEASLMETVRGVATIYLVTPDGSTGAASGIFINANGATLTNAHVVEGMQRVAVVDMETSSRFKEPRLYDATVIKTSPYYDLALVDIHRKTPHYLHFADEAGLEVGQPVMAIGNPQGLAASVSQGIISAIRTNREMRQPFIPLPNMRMSEREFEQITWLQTDASVNPGNSGGPLLNARHEIVGMNTFIVTQSGGSQGLNFALHVKHLKKFAAGYYKAGAPDKP